MPDLTDVQQAISDAEALGVTEGQLYELAKVALAQLLKGGAPTTSLTLPTGVSYTVDLPSVRALVAELRPVAQAERGGSIATARAVLP